jgi:hypothetical protein
VIDSLSALARFVRTAPTGDLLAPVTLTLRAWPWLCNFSGHVNKAHCIDLVGVGRAAFLHRTGLFQRAMLGGHAYVVAGTGTTYRRSIPSLGCFTRGACKWPPRASNAAKFSGTAATCVPWMA